MLNGIKRIIIYGLLGTLSLGSCSSDKPSKKTDEKAKSKESFRDKLKQSSATAEIDSFRTDGGRQEITVTQSLPAPDIPKLVKLLVPPLPPQIQGDKLISFSVTEDVPIKDVLIEIGRMADVDVQVDKNITGGIILKVKKKPLKLVLERICKLARLKFSFEDGILSFERDIPYRVNYTLDFMPEGDLWGAIESSVNEILELLDNEDESFKQDTASQNASGGLSQNPDGSFNDTGIIQSTNNTSQGKSKVIINKPANILTVFANSRAQRAIAEYLAEARKNSSAQVLIEIKMVEVNLNDQHQNGIDWSWFNANSRPGTDVPITGTGGGSSGGGNGGSGSGESSKTPGESFSLVDNALSIGVISRAIFGGSLDATVSLMETFGKTRTVSSPRINAINNQESTFSFVDKEVYFSIETDNVVTGDNNPLVENNVTSTKEEVEVGVTMTINPTINLEAREVTLRVEPEMSVISRWVEDPANTKSLVPVIQSRKIETTMKLKDGDIMVIGGLMKDTTTNTESGVPGLRRIPVLGWLFKYQSKKEEVIETVIFIKATIIDNPSVKNKLDGHSQYFYDKYGGN